MEGGHVQLDTLNRQRELHMSERFWGRHVVDSLNKKVAPNQGCRQPGSQLQGQSSLL
ncbi:hypothetical protein EMIT0P294_10139 [Pseudomonas sp. IT-P294]